MLGNYNEEKQPLILDAEGSYNLMQIARWGKFLAVAGIVFMAIMLLVLVGLAFILFGYPDSLTSETATKAIMNGIIMLIMIGIYIYPTYALYKFAVQSKVAINSGDQQLFNSSVRYLKGLFKFMGILTLVMICLYALIFILAIVAGGFAAMAQ